MRSRRANASVPVPALALSLSLSLTLASLSVAGCLASDDSDDAEGSHGPPPHLVDPAWANTTHVPFLSGTYVWHDPASDPVDAYDAAAQNVAQPCLFQGEDDDRPEPYFTNLQLTPDGPPEQPVLPGTTHLEATLSWSDEDWQGDTLYLAWIGGDAEQYRVGGPIPNGEATLVPIKNTTWNQNGSTNWDIWVCLTGQGSATPEHQTFLGELDVELRLAREA